MDQQKQIQFKKTYNYFKTTEAYQERLQNFCVVPILKEIISETLKNGNLLNEHLTGFIHMFKWDCADETFDRYLNQNVQNEEIRQQLSNKAYACGEFGFGYTGAGKRAIWGLSTDQLSIVKIFLVNAFLVTNANEAVEIISEYERHRIPQVTKGIYSPWLYYINPLIFPIINTTHLHFLKWIGASDNYASCIEIYALLKNEVGENELGPLDKMTYEFETYLQNISTEQASPIMSYPLNTILYGPPGTGKTYSTIDKALAIVDPDFYANHSQKEQRTERTRRFNELLIKDFDKLEGQIAFCTFHQSMSYEDFVEGIKPLLNQEEDADYGAQIKYEVKNGIFKTLAKIASNPVETQTLAPNHPIRISEGEFAEANFFKMSLGDTQNEDDNQIFEDCIQNGYIALGWGGTVDYTSVDRSMIYKTALEHGQGRSSSSHINRFINEVRPGNYVVVSRGNFRFRAIGRVTGEYEYNPDLPYPHLRNVEWLLQNIDLPVADIFAKQFSQKSLYRLNKDWIKKEFFVPVEVVQESDVTTQIQKFVLIIDEINRGNVSAILGELITLLEDGKRAGQDEALTITLPYSKESFSVPSNLYIIGTMNTADRSVEALDTALRRRFVFEEKGPQPSELSITEDGINLSELLTAINERLEILIDRDHTIGHAWLMGCKNAQDLKKTFENKVLPLLQEFFYNDYSKIGLVLGDAFFEEIKLYSESKFAAFKAVAKDARKELASKLIYRLRMPADEDLTAAFKAIYTYS